MKLYVRNKIISLREGSVVTDDNGNHILKVKGKFFTFTRKKYICDLDGNVIYTVRNKFWRFIMPRSFIFDSNKKKIAKIKQRMSIKSKYTSDLGELKIRIGHEKILSRMDIYINEQKVASYSRNYLFVDSFEIEYEDPSLAPLLTAIVICLDNMHDDLTNTDR